MESYYIFVLVGGHEGADNPAKSGSLRVAFTHQPARPGAMAPNVATDYPCNKFFTMGPRKLIMYE